MSIQLAFRGGQLQLLEQVGSGATSQVWRGQLEPAGGSAAPRPVAVKIARTVADRSLLAVEAERLLWANSYATAQLIDLGRIRHSSDDSEVATDAACLVLSWIGAQSLAQLKIESSADAARQALHLARDIGEALSDLHQAGFAHGDVKPANIVANESMSEGEVGRWVLVDMGLSDSVDVATPRGATPRYLAPEALRAVGKGDGRTRDVWALGVVLAETARRLGHSRFDISAALGDGLPEPLSTLIRSCLATCPGTRSSTRWVSRRAATALPERLNEAERRSRRIRRLERAYLQARRGDIIAAARYQKVEIEVRGAAEAWLSEALRLLRGLFELRTEAIIEGNSRLGDTSPLDRQRILTNVVGPVAASWPVDASESEEPWLEHWLDLCASTDESGWTLSQRASSRNVRDPSPKIGDLAEIALELGAGSHESELLDAAEQLATVGPVPASFRIALACRLRAAGESGRALSLLENQPDALTQAEAAETARRAGDRVLAREKTAALTEHADPAVRARAIATRARLELDEGHLEVAQALLALAPLTAAVCESQALVQLASGDRKAARLTITQGRSLPAGDEEHARLEGLIGMLEHADGDAVSSALAFRRAVDLAARSGAVLEEATYLTGLANASVNSGALGEALAASERAITLFEVLNRPTEAARAALNLVVAHSETGRVEETRVAFDFALTLARQSQDARCLGYLHLALADVLPIDCSEATELLQRAGHWLNPLGTEPELWVAARHCERKGEVPLEYYDKRVRQPGLTLETRLLWWGARARRAVVERATQDAAVIFGELTQLAAVRAPLFTQGRALAAGIELAAFIGAGDVARRLTQTVSELARRLFANCPSELHPALDALPWVASVRAPHEMLLSPEQIVDIEGLVRSLSRRDELRGLLEQIVDVLVLWTGVERGLILLRAPGGKLVPRVGRNLARADLVGEQRELSHSLAEQALALGEPIVAVDATRELESVHASVHALKLRSVLAVPLIAHGEALGVVYLDDRARQGAFGQRELAWVRLVATVAAVAIADVRDRLILRRTARRAERAERRVSSALAHREAELGQVRVELARTREARPTRFRYDAIIGDSLAMRDLLALVDRVVESDVPVLIMGESGTGKELIARAIHENGPRTRGEFVAENCGAIPETLLESALFGHARGAFTGAVRARAGLFEIADQGTLFLDEIAEMSLGMQTKLLRVLENGELRPVGSERTRRVNVRVIGATHQNVTEMVRAGTFREDLFYRLDVVTLAVPPLRQRHGDIPTLARYFLARHAGGRKFSVPQRTYEVLARYAWPGNIRQLENEIRRAIVLADAEILPEHLSAEVRAIGDREFSTPDGMNLRDRTAALELDLVRLALERTEGNLTRAAELLGLSRFGLQKMLKRLAGRLAEVTGPKPSIELSGLR